MYFIHIWYCLTAEEEKRKFNNAEPPYGLNFCFISFKFKGFLYYQWCLKYIAKNKKNTVSQAKVLYWEGYLSKSE